MLSNNNNNNRGVKFEEGREAHDAGRKKAMEKHKLGNTALQASERLYQQGKEDPRSSHHCHKNHNHNQSSKNNNNNDNSNSLKNSNSQGSTASTFTANSSNSTNSYTNNSNRNVHHPPSDPFQESVYRLIPEVPPPPSQHKKYQSHFAGQARAEYTRNVKPMASMGPAKVQLNRPSDFLKKHEKEPKLPAPKEFHYDQSNRRPKVPPNDAQAAKEIMQKLHPKSNVDRIKVNALQTIGMTPKPHGIQEPKYREKKDYGKTPSYLVKRKQDNQKNMEAIQAQERYRIEQENKMFSRMSEEDRVRILEGLKGKWERLNSDYQKLSLTVDTVPKINRKVNMESQLKLLEQDIEKFSQPNLFIKSIN